MASSPALNKPSGARPPFSGGPIRTTFAPEPEDNPNYLLERVGAHVLALEQYAVEQECDPEIVLDLLNEIYGWVEHLLNIERAMNPILLPPGNGALYSLEYLLDVESESVSTYKRMLERLDVLRPGVEIQAKVQRLLGFKLNQE